ncbi:Hint domain-containing protein [Ruegeria sp. R14_0]|uniref:Hint domain-containing protein n=1 Tax=Ruegeria sp. R14_0 TaxID=2821100 RepID=UPI001ADA7A2E|nr:Hint domain-containing protein [Ruegeria sp. R14_0]MBO9445693.1 Hint domain-containing protein [Ruegeria sp. R14_0]
MARISELHYSNAYAAQTGVAEFLEVALRSDEDPANFTVSFYQANGQVGIEVPLDDPSVQVSIDPDNNEQVFIISADDFPILLTDPNGGGANNFEAYALTNTSTGEVIDFYDIGGGTTNIVAQNGLAAGVTSENLPVLVSPNQTTTTLQFNQPDPDTLVYGTLSPGDTGAPCFAAGTLVDTPDGPRRVETLKPGDLVMTQDDGACPIRWVGGRTVVGRGRFTPVRIHAGALGAERDVVVSPQHRLLVTGWQAQLLCGEDEVLIAAKSLVNETTITSAPCDLVRYVHLFFERHQLVTTSGLISESFFPGAQALSSLDRAAADELFALFPELRKYPQSYGPTIRPVQCGPQAAMLRAI